jgi:hypothetical protein
MRHKADKMLWWRDAKFGMFIHWGLYAVPAGVWKGKPVEGIGEWIAAYAKIPPDEYAQLAKRFNPREFDADVWAKLAKGAGMKYLVFTAKHADGFAMYRSRCRRLQPPGRARRFTRGLRPLHRAQGRAAGKGAADRLRTDGPLLVR